MCDPKRQSKKEKKKKGVIHFPATLLNTSYRPRPRCGFGSGVGRLEIEDIIRSSSGEAPWVDIDPQAGSQGLSPI
jgi:hypothetical protein